MTSVFSPRDKEAMLDGPITTYNIPPLDLSAPLSHSPPRAIKEKIASAMGSSPLTSEDGGSSRKTGRSKATSNPGSATNADGKSRIGTTSFKFDIDKSWISSQHDIPPDVPIPDSEERDEALKLRQELWDGLISHYEHWLSTQQSEDDEVDEEEAEAAAIELAKSGKNPGKVRLQAPVIPTTGRLARYDGWEADRTLSDLRRFDVSALVYDMLQHNANPKVVNDPAETTSVVPHWALQERWDCKSLKLSLMRYQLLTLSPVRSRG